MSISVDLVRGQAIRQLGSADDLVPMTIMTDSRRRTEHGLFVPLVGPRFDGHRFLNQAIDNGAEAALWMAREPIPSNVPDRFPLFLVGDTLTALQSMAKSYLRRCRPKVVAVTGSNGKTTTKDMTECVLHGAFRTFKTPGNLNNHIGVPLTILSMPEDTEVLVCEMGMNHFGELARLSQLAAPDMAIITNIGESHIEYLGSRKGIAKAKLEIVRGLKKDGTLIIDGDEPLLRGFRSTAFRIVTCGYGQDNDWRITDLLQEPTGCRFTLNDGNQLYTVPLPGKHNAKNAAYSLVAAKILNADEESMVHGLKNLSLTGMRLERVAGLAGAELINDCYNASPSSMKASVETVKSLPGFRKRVAVLGDMYELGPDERRMHRSVAEVLTHPLTHVVTIGEKGAWIAEAVRERPGQRSIVVRSFVTGAAALPYLRSLLDRDTVMLFKASRLMGLEKIAAALKSKESPS